MLLVKLNAANSPVWTSKTDVFTPEQSIRTNWMRLRIEVDRAIACYIDLLPRNEQNWNDLMKAEDGVRSFAQGCGRIGLSCCRVDIVDSPSAGGGYDQSWARRPISPRAGQRLIEAKERLARVPECFHRGSGRFPDEPQMVQAVRTWT